MSKKGFFYFSSFEKIVALALIALVSVSIVFNYKIANKNKELAMLLLEGDSLFILSSVDTVDVSRLFNKTSHNNKVVKEISQQAHDIKINKQPRYKEEHPVYEKQEKFTAHQSIQLNEKDTSEWKKVPGIGSAFSNRIVNYGNKLGGYISHHQLKEVYGVTDEMYEKIIPFIIDNETDDTKRIDINLLEFKEILAHPYLNFEQVKAIMNLRRKNGYVGTVEELSMLEEFTNEDIQRVAPYLSFRKD